MLYLFFVVVVAVVFLIVGLYCALFLAPISPTPCTEQPSIEGNVWHETALNCSILLANTASRSAFYYSTQRLQRRQWTFCAFLQTVSTIHPNTRRLAPRQLVPENGDYGRNGLNRNCFNSGLVTCKYGRRKSYSTSFRPDYRKYLSPEILYIPYKWFAS